jgi:hypothetical protein
MSLKIRAGRCGFLNWRPPGLLNKHNSERPGPSTVRVFDDPISPLLTISSIPYGEAALTITIPSQSGTRIEYLPEHQDSGVQQRE